MASKASTSQISIPSLLAAPASSAGLRLAADGMLGDANGHPREIVGVAGDVPEREEERRFRDSAARIQMLVDKAPVAIAVIRAGATVWVNETYLRMSGYTERTALVGRPFAEQIAPSERAGIAARMRRRAAGLPERTSYDTIGLRGDGTTLPIHIDVVEAELPDGPAFLAYVTDLTEREEAQRAVRESETRFGTLIDRSPVAISLSRAGVVVWANDAYLRLYGFTGHDEIVGHRIVEVFAPESHGLALEVVRRRARAEEVESPYEAVGQRRDGSTFPMHVEAVTVSLPDGPATAAFITDLTQIRAGEEARRQAQSDALTGLPNRRQLDAALAGRLENFRRYGWSFGLLIVDIDHFKAVNDSLGHSGGDEVLRGVAEAMATGLRRGDVLGRWGGEEFVVLVDGVGGHELAGFADRLRALVARAHITHQGVAIGVRVSIGAAVASVEDCPDTLFERADRAVYQAKEAGRDRVVLAAAKDQIPDASLAFRVSAVPRRTRASLPLSPVT